METKQNDVKRLVLNAVLVGIYIVLSYLAIPFLGLKITFEHFPVIISGILFGPVDAMLVGGVGEFLNQLTSFGMTPTTFLWVLPIVIRGLLIGLFAKALPNAMGITAICSRKIPVVFYTVCIGSGLLASCVNTFAYYVDSKMFGYYQYALVFGMFFLRLLLSAISSVLMCLMAKGLLHALRKQKLI